MDRIIVHGRIPLRGQLTVQGSKNAALPILAATILTEETCVIHNCPKIVDVHQMLFLLGRLGCEVRWDSDGVRVFGREILEASLLFPQASQMRSSVLFLGAMLGRTGTAQLPYPGGCVIGQRPIDIHIEALRNLNVEIECRDDKLIASTGGMIGNRVFLPFPSVGATENVMLAAVKAQGKTQIEGAAKEPEVVALGHFLKAMGAQISGLGSSCIEIEGNQPLHGTEFRIPADRIVAGTYLLACMSTGGSVLLKEVPVEDMESFLAVLNRMGGCLQIHDRQIYLQAPKDITPVEYIQTQVHPGFPTDLQSQLLATLCLAKGESRIQEEIFEQRFRVVPWLKRMGAQIEMLAPNLVRTRGVEMLTGSLVRAEDLRGGAALVIAALGAKGETVIEGKEYIDRGYANICKDLRDLGARIYSV